MKCSLGIYSFLEESSSLSHSVVSLYSLHCSFKKAFLSLLDILCNSAFRWVYLNFSPLPFTSLLFSVISKASSGNHFAFVHFFFNPWVWKIPWRREWLPTPVCLPGEFHGQRSLVGCSPGGLQTVSYDRATNTFPLSLFLPVASPWPHKLSNKRSSTFGIHTELNKKLISSECRS